MITKNDISTALFTLALLCVFGATGCESARKVGRDPLLGQTRLTPPQTDPRSVYVDRRNSVESGVVPGTELATAPQTHQTNYPTFLPTQNSAELRAESYQTRFSYDKIMPESVSAVPGARTPQRFSPYERDRRTLLSEFQKEVPARSVPVSAPQPSQRLQPSTPSGAIGREVREIRSDLPPAPDVLPPSVPTSPPNPEAEPGVLYFHLLPE